MITIIVGTNRKDAVSAKMAQFYKELILLHGEKAQILDLRSLPHDFIFSALYENSGKNDLFNPFRKLVESSEKFIFIVPEYNGSFPGVLKAFIDGLKYPDSFRNKKCAMVGLSNGMQGSGLAISHLTDICNYLGMHVLAQKVKLAFIGKNFDGEEMLNDFYTQLIKEQIDLFIKF